MLTEEKVNEIIASDIMTTWSKVKLLTRDAAESDAIWGSGDKNMPEEQVKAELQSSMVSVCATIAACHEFDVDFEAFMLQTAVEIHNGARNHCAEKRSGS